MPFMPVTESMFLVAETREHPMHVGGLQLFVPPDGEEETFGQKVYETFEAATDVYELFRKRPAPPVNVMGTLRWIFDDDLDFEHHVRRIMLPRPGRVRELLRYVSAEHGAPLDRHRPMWELHIIEGLADGRLALYSKIHHSLVDGVSALKLFEKTLTPDPDRRDCGPIWDPALFRKKKSSAVATTGGGALAAVSTGVKAAGELAGMGPAAARIGWNKLRGNDMVLPLTAPHTMLNVPIGGARRFASQQWSKTRMTDVASALGVTLNDVVLTMCAGALRSYLIDRNALPDQPLVAMVPVSMREAGADASGGNAVTTVLCNLGTDQPDPERRLAAVVRSMNDSKAMMRNLSPLQALGYGAAVMAPLLLTPVPGFVRNTPPPFNVIISNVPGPKTEMYWNGARLDGVYPASIVLDGQALNITLATNADNVNFGLVGDRRSVPSLQRMLTHLDTALEELEKLA
ncbi:MULTISPECIES: WS/DGAT/MGAT family O-acyltransferase [Nocardiaceae]|uniref:Diacylglycerol O-acyltransferase n=1 Tax=Rhodococcoides kroppenstedtii TaxID=293050 RepID=A0ABS7NY50_9NOCA|nr:MULTISPECIES: wax ester/triacylglycerol synthase family O-acyltransferase [Rhodococcus]AMY19924.1 putative diacylglycerol O-acyltransferase tgs2 [Rhodococcus sp. PBTS 1]MBY6314671.1 wax ester/triacylglycerol synthase family O-acyltransferase [Rhodococcus kroppenstedtii]MBY6322478.1 wax ester/triacylglycerol synthase family O-acyltransferase [Rhodococcus kroppenstedtii]MBY6401282.1 wax ester/triacylglycerol synthase family O-acyltransferase [Rhodococcus kroppenstedtii]MBY6437843.1 wax ester/